MACGGGSNLEKTAGAGFGGAALFVLHEYLEFGLYYSIALLCCFCGAGPIRAGAEPASPNKESLAPAVSLWFYGAADCGPSVWVWFYNIQHVVRQPYTIATQKNIRDEGYTLAFLSDVHYGLTVNGDELQRYANAIAEEQPDLVLLGGDIVDESTTLEEMQQVLACWDNSQRLRRVLYIRQSRSG